MAITIHLWGLIILAILVITIAVLLTHYITKDRTAEMYHILNGEHYEQWAKERESLYKTIKIKQEFNEDLASQLNQQRGHIEVCEAFFEKIFRDNNGSIPTCDRFFVYHNKIFEATSFSLTENAESSPELLVVFKDTGFKGWFRKES